MKVVITGMGIYSCLGENINAVTESLKAGKSGIGIDPARQEMGYRSSLTGIVKEPDLKKALPRRARMGMSEQAKYAYVSTKEALDMANVTQEYLNENRAGILFGNDSSAKAVIEAFVRTYVKRRRFFIVKRAARLELPAGFLQLDPLADNLDDVRASDQIVNEILRDQSGHIGLNGDSGETGFSLLFLLGLA